MEGERAAWRTADEFGLKLATILPAGIIGPGFVRNTPTIDLIEAMMRGAMRLGMPPNTYPIVDVRVVVAAHVLAGERDCEGRFIVCNDHVPTFREVVETMRAVDAHVPLPWMTLSAAMAPLVPWFDRLNARLLGVPRTATPEVARTFSDHVWNPTNRHIREVLG